MTIDFTPAARELVRDAGERARSLGHRGPGGAHLLLALAAHDGPAGEVVRRHGLTVPRIEKCLLATNPGSGEGLFGSLDGDALASIGIDLDAVRDAVESSSGPTAFRPQPGRPRRFSFRTPSRFVRRRRHPGRIGNPRSGRIVIDVDHLAFRLATTHRGAAHDILGTLGVSGARLADDLLAGLRRAG